MRPPFAHNRRITSTKCKKFPPHWRLIASLAPLYSMESRQLYPGGFQESTGKRTARKRFTGQNSHRPTRFIALHATKNSCV